MNTIIEIVKDTNNHQEEEVILTINDSYNRMDLCDYVMPVPETEVLNYRVVKEQPKVDEYFEVDYSL